MKSISKEINKAIKMFRKHYPNPTTPIIIKMSTIGYTELLQECYKEITNHATSDEIKYFNSIPIKHCVDMPKYIKFTVQSEQDYIKDRVEEYIRECKKIFEEE